MSFANYKPATEAVKFAGGQAAVRGLNTEDISDLIRIHLDDMENLFSLFQDASANVAANQQSKAIVIKLIKDAPHLAAQIVAMAAGEPDSYDAIRSLPFPTMVDAIEKIGRLTFEEVGGAGNFVATLKGLMAGLQPAAKVAGNSQAS